MEVWAAGLAGRVLVFLQTAVVASWPSRLCMGMWLMPQQRHRPRVCVKTPENKCVGGAPCSAGSWLWRCTLSQHATEAGSIFAGGYLLPRLPPSSVGWRAVGRTCSWKAGGILKRPLTAGWRLRVLRGHGLSREKACRMAAKNRKSSARAKLSPRQTRLPGEKRETGLRQLCSHPGSQGVPRMSWGAGGAPAGTDSWCQPGPVVIAADT